DALQFGLERTDVRNVLQYIGAEDDIEIVVRERDMNSVVFDDRPDLIGFIVAGRDVDRRDAKTALAQLLRLPARPSTDLKDLRAFAQVRRDPLELVQSNIGQVFDGIHIVTSGRVSLARRNVRRLLESVREYSSMTAWRRKHRGKSGTRARRRSAATAPYRGGGRLRGCSKASRYG